MTQLEELTKNFHITLNGINAEVYNTADGILVSNNDFSDPDLDYDEVLMSYEQFKEKLIENDGKFSTS